MSRAERFWRFVASHVLASLAGVSLLALTLVVAYDVVARYFFASSTRWATEFGQYLMAATVMLGAAYTLAQRGHVRVEILYDRLSARMRSICDFLAGVVALAFCVVLAWQSWNLAWRSWENTSRSLDLGIVLFWPQILVPLGALFLGIESILLLRAATARLTQHDPGSAAKDE